MLEDPRMDKKSQNRSLQSQSRALAVDCKKSSELTHKPWPRSSKKRDGSGSSSKSEPYRKNVPAQRGKGQLDKRPRTRGASGYAVGGAQNPGIEDEDEPEIGSVFVQGSKKQNLNHLLNFMYPSRAAQNAAVRDRPALRRQNQQRVMRWHNQDLYLRANCQFVVKEDGDYRENLKDPDVPMKWEQIEEVIVRSTGKSECPICLGAPVAGRVGLCGHVYCWACVLHYAAAHDKQPPPCPVCTTPLIVKDMKPTRMIQWEAPGEEVTMRLVRRLRGSRTVEIAPPRGHISENDTDIILPMESLHDSPYNKLFYASKQQIHDILERDRKEIQDQILAEIDTTEVVFLEQALELLRQKEENIKKQVEVPKDAIVEEQPPPIDYQGPEINGNRVDWFDVDHEGAAAGVQNDMLIMEENMGHLDINEKSDLNPEAPSFEQNENQHEEFPLTNCVDEEQSLNECNFNEFDKINQAKYFYFYQAEDGQQVFLDSLNVRMLNSSWGALVAAPAVIKGRVLHRETLSLDDQNRKPYTAHLPLYCAFDIVELDLKPPYVTIEALDNFKAELERRARFRARQERDERRRERAYQRKVEGPPKPDFSSEVLFPPAVASSPPLSDASFSPLDQATPSTSAVEIITPPQSTGLSFAKMAGTTGTWRVRKTTAPPAPPPGDEDIAAPRTLSLSDAIEAALQASPAANGKKKKSKQKVLFATGMNRAG